MPIRGAKGYSITFNCPQTNLHHPLLLDDVRVAVTPLAGSYRIAGTLELDGLDMGINRQRLLTIQSQTNRYLPKLGGMEVKEVWRGLRPCTPDGLPVLGRVHPYDNLFVAGGLGTKGMLLGPVTGKYISRMLAGEETGMVERSLRPNRF
jgi:D-amino-acid dehydrogenase